MAVPAAVAVIGYVLTLLGPALSWPGWVVDLSPFSHLAYVPEEPLAVTSAVVWRYRLRGGRLRSGGVRPAGPHRRLTGASPPFADTATERGSRLVTVLRPGGS